jgi:hypothetical protein
VLFGGRCLTVAGDGRKPADEVLASLLAAGVKHCDAALRSGVSERTVQRRLQDPEFVAMVQRLRSEMVSQAAGRLADTLAEASDVLRGLLADPDPHVKHKSAVKVIELGLKVAELTELQKRVEQLEAMLSDKRQP